MSKETKTYCEKCKYRGYFKNSVFCNAPNLKKDMGNEFTGVQFDETIKRKLELNKDGKCPFYKKRGFWG